MVENDLLITDITMDTIKNSVTQPGKGLNTDFSPQVQPEGTYRYALNAVNETELGDSLFISNEEGNELCTSIPEGFLIVGKRYIGNGDTVLFLVNKTLTISEIGIFNEQGSYTTYVNDSLSTAENKLNFNIANQISCTYRLRRGFERTIYFTDGVNPPRYFNFDKPNNFKKLGLFDSSLFKLFKEYTKIPSFDSIKVKEDGLLPPGSYNISIQLVDKDLNPTEWITTTNTIIIYNDSLNKDYFQIRGSTNEVDSYHNFGPTNKSISVTLSNLDTDYAGYRLALIEANNGSGKIVKISVTDFIDITNLNFTFNGSNTVSTITEEEIKKSRNTISSALHIEQLENRLLLSNTKSKDLKWGNLQKYASKIKTDLVLKRVQLNRLVTNNPKNPTVNIESRGYMPGEVYSLGIVWVFEDGDTSPVYHIPGKGSTEPLTPYTTGTNVFSMRNTDNICSSATYTTLNNDSFNDYWGKDSANLSLKDTPVRHHRFPLRSEIGKPVVEKFSKPDSRTFGYDADAISSEIFGLRFSNIEFPNINETNGYKIIGYYIVRNERTDDNKTIVDNGILTPLIKHDKDPSKPEESDYTSFGLLRPHFSGSTYSKIKRDIVGLINPEFLFNRKEYNNVTIIQEGDHPTYTIQKGNFLTQDVMDGTTYDADAHKTIEKDLDGFSLNSFVRDTTLFYTKKVKTIFANSSSIKEIFYLKGLAYKTVIDTDNKDIPVYNVTCDNNIGIVNLKDKITDVQNILNIPYVVLKRSLNNFYSTFRTLPYYKESTLNDSTTCDVFNGDSYITPIRYSNTMFYDVALRNRALKSSWWKTTLGMVLVNVGIGVGILGTIASAGTLTVPSIGLGLLIAGFGISLIKTGVEGSIMEATYKDAYDKGLRFTVEDDLITHADYFGPHTDNYGEDIEDDQIRWITDSLSNVWIESSVNMSLRNGVVESLTDFMSPSPIISLDTISGYVLNKLTVIDNQRKGGRLYRGISLPEIYEINKDYTRNNKEKVYYALGIEYDYTSKNTEVFPHRIHYSEQSFQEELTDNYRIFLPNNYRDLNGETGVITNIFKIQNNLFLHTEEALWQLPKNYQERVTNQIVSFIGTGDYFSVPPQKIVDDESGNSAGNLHKWGTKKTQHGYFFVCEKQNCIYLFNGQQLKPLTDSGIKNSIYYKIPVSVNDTLLPGLRYNNDDNPYNPVGTGFICTYDSKKERVIFTKRDFVFNDSIIDTKDFHVIYNNDSIIVFEDYNTKINAKLALGYDYLGIVNNQMKFYKSYDNTVVYLDGTTIQDYKKYDKSWTISYSLNTNTWVSWHSYLPNIYLETSQNFFSIIAGENEIWKHNSFGKYQTFYNKRYPFTIEYVSKSDNGTDKIWDNLTILAEAKKYDFENKEFINVKNVFFNKAIFYNSRQCSGQLNIINKTLDSNYLVSQIDNTVLNNVFAEKRESVWNINNLIDFRTDYSKPIFKSDDASLKNEYPYDKVVNTSAISFQKDWSELESFRDKYLVIRFIFDTFADIKLIVNYSIENQLQSFK